MQREIKEDFGRLEHFVKNYKIQISSSNPSYNNLLRKKHKKLFSLFSFYAEFSEKKLLCQDSLMFFQETISDLGQALFCWLHGAYKPSSMLLRSSIETFLRAFGGQTNREIHKERNMYCILDLSKKETFFCDCQVSLYYNRIENIYKHLCEIVHTSRIDSTSQISSLKSFPVFNERIAGEICDYYCELIGIMLIFLYFNYFKICWSMHHENRNNFFRSISSKVKREIYDYYCS